MIDKTVLESVVPPEFARNAFNSTLRRVLTSNDQKFQSKYGEDFYNSFWAVAFRFFTCAEHDNAFTESINRAGVQPPRLEQYIQERELFGFFISGQASLESFAYSCYSFGAILNETQFSITDPRKITLSATVDKYQKYFQMEPLTEALKSLKDSSEFDEWSTIRNINAHRLMPGRLNTVTIFPAQPNGGMSRVV